MSPISPATNYSHTHSLPGYIRSPARGGVQHVAVLGERVALVQCGDRGVPTPLLPSATFQHDDHVRCVDNITIFMPHETMSGCVKEAILIDLVRAARHVEVALERVQHAHGGK